MAKIAVTHPETAANPRAIRCPDQVRLWQPGETHEFEASEEVAANLARKGFIVKSVAEAAPLDQEMPAASPPRKRR